jgi:hypothetical protein
MYDVDGVKYLVLGRLGISLDDDASVPDRKLNALPAGRYTLPARLTPGL